jgi:hypothetical protein
MNTYYIPEGDHYSSLIPAIPQIPTPPGFHNGATLMTGKFNITSSCKYDFSNVKPCVNDTNKLCGIGYGIWPNSHHIWSIRIGWRVNSTGKLILNLYAYVDGKRVVVNVGTGRSFNFDTEYEFSIKNDLLNKLAVVTINGLTVSIPFSKSPTAGYVLKPYFGGDCDAPQDMYIKLVYNVS